MYDTTIAAKLLKQLESFLGRISPHFHKPAARFIGDMMYGIMAEKDVKLSSIVRALKEGITPKKVEDRLSRMLSSNGLERDLHDVIAAEGARKVHRDTLIILDPSDVQKPYAKKMEHLAKVWDGSKGEVGDNLGYWGRKGSEHIDTVSLIQLIISVHIPDAASSGARGRFGRQVPSSASARGNTG